MRKPCLFMRLRSCFLLLGLGLILFAPGCAYHIRPPYDPAIRTIYVPIFKSTVFRREVNLQMTEQIQKEIEKRTGYKVVDNPEDADVTLEGTISFVDKNLQVENPNNLARQLLATMLVTVKMVDNRSGVATDSTKEIAPVPVSNTVPFFDEVGETSQLGYYKVMNTIVEEVVGMMEERW